MGRLTGPELSELSPDQRLVYERQIAAADGGGEWLREYSTGKPWSRGYWASWKSVAGPVFGGLFLFGSWVLFPVAWSVAPALEPGSKRGWPALALYAASLALLFAVTSSICAVARTKRRASMPSSDELRAAHVASIEASWRARSEERRDQRLARAVSPRPPVPTKSASNGTAPGQAIGRHPGVVGPAGRASTWSSSSNSSGTAQPPAGTTFGADTARGASASVRGSITAGNRVAPGAAAFAAWISAEDKWTLVRRHESICQLCLEWIDTSIPHDYENPDPRRLDIDHIVPRAHGGSSDDLDNLQPVHHGCNLRKGGRLMSNAEYRTECAALAKQASQSRAADTPRSVGGQRRDPALPARTATSRVGSPREQQGPVGSRERQSREQGRRSDAFWSKPHANLLTHCQYGHEFTEENTYYRMRFDRAPEIERNCRACIRGRE